MKEDFSLEAQEVSCGNCGEPMFFEDEKCPKCGYPTVAKDQEEWRKNHKRAE